jgi:hypothetical protein
MRSQEFKTALLAPLVVTASPGAQERARVRQRDLAQERGLSPPDMPTFATYAIEDAMRRAQATSPHRSFLSEYLTVASTHKEPT